MRGGTPSHTGIYIHIPFCRKKCSFCDFTAYGGQENRIPEYLGALFDEIASVASLPRNDTRERGEEAETIFFGGGTPSLLSSEEIGSALTCLRQNLRIKPDAECSLEAEPGTLTREKLAGFRAHGVNRLSLGLQAWQDDILKALGRVHTREDFLGDFETARRAGFDNINADLMFGLPNQRLAHWEETLKEVIALGPEHLSAYQLSVEEKTVFGRKALAEADEDLCAEMYSMAIKKLGEAGYVHYEVSNWAKRGRMCLHNLNTWLHKPYIGFGTGAVSFDGKKRWKNETALSAYIRKIVSGLSPIAEEEALGAKDLASDEMILGLRLREGVYLSKSLRERFEPAIENLTGLGLLEFFGGNLRLSSRGIFLGNLVWQAFI